MNTKSLRVQISNIIEWEKAVDIVQGDCHQQFCVEKQITPIGKPHSNPSLPDKAAIVLFLFTEDFHSGPADAIGSKPSYDPTRL
jgi:hypothetical protein